MSSSAIGSGDGAEGDVATVITQALARVLMTFHKRSAHP